MDVANQVPVRILFIGNSFTYFNNLPEQIAGLARPHTAVRVGTIAAGGAELGSTWNSGQPTSMLADGWDYVVLQEQSTLGNGQPQPGIPRVQPPAQFHEAVRTAVPEIEAAGATPVLYLTWARRDDPEAQHALDDAYTAIAAETNSMLAPVGPAWRMALTERPTLSLHEDDNSHPTATGSYLAACVLYATLFGRDPRGCAHKLTGMAIDSEGERGPDNSVLVDLPADDAAYLQDVAWRATR